jgi:hypothetical protein
MRLVVLALVSVLSSAPAALAAPAKPAAGIAAPEQTVPQPSGPSETQLFGIVCFIGGLLALFALLPDFEDGQGGGWDRQEDDQA